MVTYELIYSNILRYCGPNPHEKEELVSESFWLHTLVKKKYSFQRATLREELW